MSRLRKIAVIDDEKPMRQLLVNALSSEFEVSVFAGGREALAQMQDNVPDLIVCDVRMPDMDGLALLQAVKASPELRDVPFIFLSGVQSNEQIVALLEGGADDFVGKPFHVGRFVARVRALMRVTDRRRDALSGPVGRVGTLPLLKFCEDSRLTGRLTVEGKGQKRWAEFLGGEVVHAGGTPDTGEDALDALLAMEGGGYRIEQARLDREALRLVEMRAPAEAPTAEEAKGPAPLPGGRLSMIEVRGQNVQVQTECENRPAFTVTTVIARGGQIIRKIESAWQHPLQRREDQEVARSQVDRQHDRVVATLRELTEARAAAAAAADSAPGVDASLLAWAVSFIAEQARDELGAVMTVALLRRSYKKVSSGSAALLAFRIVEDGRVVHDAPAARVEPPVVEAVAAWAAAFVSAAGGAAERLAGLKVRQVTRLMEAELERAGFYDAYDAAAAL